MKRMEIDRMTIDNFKGIRHMEIDFGEVTEISGANGSGKSTIADAFNWVLLNKDAHGNAPGSDNFREKPVDENGREIHHIETTVTLECTLDGKRFDLKRTQAEKWTKKRGHAEDVYGGNESRYSINEVEMKQAEFKNAISEIAPEEIFRMVATLGAFNALDWKKRRAMLVEIAGNDVDARLLEEADYADIREMTAEMNVSVDELRKVLTDRRKLTNDKLKMIPVRIDEVKRGIPNVTQADVDAAKIDLHDSEHRIAELEEELARVKAGNSGNGREKLLALQSELVSARRRIADELEAKYRKASAESDFAADSYRRIAATLVDARKKCERYAQYRDAEAVRRDALRDEYRAKRAEPLPVVSTVCPVCGQDLPNDQVEKAQDAVKAQRKKQIDEIKAEGKKVADKVADHETALAQAQKELDDLTERVKAAEFAMLDAAKRLKEINIIPDYNADPHIAGLEAQIEEARNNINPAPDARIEELNKALADECEIAQGCRKTIASGETAAAAYERINQLNEELADFGAALSQLDAEIMTVERFIADRCATLESGINAKFPTVRWKLFDTQINGSMVDTCVCMIACKAGTVPYECANTAAQINADIEVINVLSEFYGVSIPLFVDNRERILELTGTNAQLITMSVSSDKELKIRR